MSHFGVFALVDGGRVTVRADRWAGAFATAWFARGPAYARAMALDFEPAAEVEGGEAGFLVDPGRKAGLFFDALVAWEGVLLDLAADREVPVSGTAVRLDRLRELDLDAAEAAFLERAFERGRESAEAFFEALRAPPFPGPDNYAGWDLRRVGGPEDFRQYLDEHGVDGREAIRSRAEQQEAASAAVDRMMLMQAVFAAEGVEGMSRLMAASAARKAAGRPPLTLKEWRAGVRE
jgi:hypothetical protein